MSDKRVYIGTLYVGENELEECIKSVENQTFSNITHEIFSYLPNKEAHDTLYSKFMKLQDEYDYFIKLDADMIFKRNTIVEELVEIFEKNKNLDHAVFSVDDWYSDSNIMGMHMFSNKVSWSISKEVLFVDPDPKRNGEKIVCWEHPAPVADHSPNPSLKEAYMFGYHRALKVVQRGRLRKDINQSKFQMALLNKAWECLVKYNDIRRLAVIKGAISVFKSDTKKLESKAILSFDEEIEMIKKTNFKKNFENLERIWDIDSLNFKYILLPKIFQSPIVILRRIKELFK